MKLPETSGLGPLAPKHGSHAPQAQAALAQYAGTTDAATQAQAIAALEGITATQVPVAPLLQGASWAEFSTSHFTGWPTVSHAYMDPGPNIPEMLAVIQHLKHVP